MNKRTGWAMRYDTCVKCEKTQYPHKGHGLCKRCYQLRDFKARKPWIVREKEKYKFRRMCKRFILNADSNNHRWNKLNDQNLLRVRASNDKTYATPIKINELDKRIEEFKTFKEVLAKEV